jgi:hypothetical protein
MSDGSTIRILPRRPTIIGGADTTLPNKLEPRAALTTFEGHPIAGREVSRPISNPIRRGPTSPEAKLEKSVKADLGEVEKAWRRYQGTHDRDAVYGYLAAVYKVVAKWKREQRAWKSAGLALKLQGDTTTIRVEPFAVLIRCTSTPDKVDGKTRSKWSRVLRVTEAFKGQDTSIKAFIKGEGGINKCAARVREIGKSR